MKVIWKFKIDPEGLCLVVPIGSHPLCIQPQGSVPHLWMLINEDRHVPKIERKLLVVGTGLHFHDAGTEYVGTWQDGWMVWHFFLETDSAAVVRMNQAKAEGV